MPEHKNNKKTYQLLKDLTSEKQGRSTTIQDRSGKCLTKEQKVLSRWTGYCSELYNCESYGDNTVLYCSQYPEEDLQLDHREEVEIAVAALKNGSLQVLIIYQQNLSVPDPRGGGGGGGDKRGTCPTKATASHTLPPEKTCPRKKLRKKCETSCKKLVQV